MRARLFPSWVLLALVMVSGAWAQPAPAIDRVDVGSIATLQRQAENGDAKAEFDLGSAYRNGHGVPQDYAESYFWLDLAASNITNDSAQDDAASKARDEVGTYLTTTVLLETQERAKQWFASHRSELATPDTMSSSSVPVEQSSGNCSSTGLDDADRLAFFTCGCSKGDMNACANLGTYYRMGWGVIKDLSQAMVLFKKACDGGSGLGCTLLDLANSSTSSVQNATQASEPTAAGPSPSSFAKTVFRPETGPAVSTVSNHPMNEDSGGCAKNISFAVAEGGQIVSRVPQFTQKWIQKNQKKYSGLFFSQTPNPQATNYVLVFSTSRSSFNGIFPTVVTSTRTNSSPVSGNGTITSNSGSMWNYTYEGTETTTTTTTTPENLPYTDTTSTLYANVYMQNGALISQRWRSITTREGGEGANTLGYNLGAALAAIHIKERLLKDAVEDVGK
jgi:hypothetical protein